MKLHGPVLVTLAALALAAPALAEESGNFVIRLGRDTVSVERYRRTPARLEVTQIARSPRVQRRQFTYDFAGDALTHLSATFTPVGAAAPAQTVEGDVVSDSIHVRITGAPGGAREVRAALPKGTRVVAYSSPWSCYESEIMKLVASKADSLRGTIYFIGAEGTSWLSLHRLGRDSVSLVDEGGDVFHVRVDRAGHVLGVLPIAGTGKFGVDRVAALDLDAMAASFAASEQAAGAMGALSPRDTLRVDNAGGASLWVDYGRPGKRGRVVFGQVVPYGEVWRTGANAATQFKTDRALDFGGTVVPAGFYTLWTVPAPGGWTLLVNAETGQWGTEHKSEKDLYRIDMKTSVLPQVVERFTIGVDPSPQGGTLHLDWDTTRASAAFTVQP